MNKRLTVITFHQPDSPTAAAARLNRLLVFFRARGWTVQVVAPLIKTSESGPRSKIASRLSKGFGFFATMVDLATRALALESQTDYYFCSAPPQGLLLTALLVLRKTQKPLIFEERDLLTINPLHNFKAVRQNFITRRTESKVLKSSALVVAVTEGVAADIKKAFGVAALTVRNGYWKPDFENLSRAKQSADPHHHPRVQVVYAGNFYGSRHPQPVLEAMKWAAAEAGSTEGARSRLLKNLSFDFTGQFESAASKKSFEAEIHDLGFESTVHLHDVVPRAEALKRLSAANLGLLITHHAGSENALPAKLFEYIAAELPILYIGHDPLVLEVIKKHDLGWVFDHRDVEGLGAFLLKIAATPEVVLTHRFKGDLTVFDAEHSLGVLENAIRLL